MGETSKAYKRRLASNWHEKYCQGNGIDIGVGRLDSISADPVMPNVLPWDKDDGDATFMANVLDESFDYVYSCHCLEHLSNPYLAIKNWWRILKHEGYLIISVPHRDLYEKKTVLPSNWNHDHKFFFLPIEDDLPYTLGLEKLVKSALMGEIYKIEQLITCDEGWIDVGPNNHSVGEFSIEIIIKKSSR